MAWNPHAPSGRRVSIALALSLAIVSCGSRFGRGSLPRQLSDDAFWALVTEVSEAPGAFPHSDNLVSNERLMPHTIRQLRASGGVYIGVGPEQNFSYIARIEPAMAFIIDIRQENRDLHLLYKALFELSADRADFVSRLFSRHRPAQLSGDPSVRVLFEAYHSATPSSELLESTEAAVRERLLETHRLPLSAAALGSIQAALHAFHADGPDITYRTSRPAENPQPSYRALMTAPDVSGRSHSYLASDEAFRFIKALHERNLIVPVVGDFGTNEGAIARVGDYVRRHGSLVSGFYGSNVQTYLNNQQMIGFCHNLATLPRDDYRTAFLHIGGTAPLRQKLATCPRRAISF
jgi:hypothetical protein